MHNMTAQSIELSSVESTDATIILIMGKTGSGKTSTINALLNLKWPTDNAVACTDSFQAAIISLQNQDGFDREWIIIDTPGLAEDLEKDEEYFAQYQNFSSLAQHILWLFQADTRTYRPDQIMLRRLSARIRSSAVLTIGLNHVDRIGPQDWDYNVNVPSVDQKISISDKIEDVCSKFSKVMPMSHTQILPYSAYTGYGLDRIRDRIFSMDGENHAI